MSQFRIFLALYAVIAIGISVPTYSLKGNLNPRAVMQSKLRYLDLQKNAPYRFQPAVPEDILPKAPVVISYDPRVVATISVATPEDYFQHLQAAEQIQAETLSSSKKISTGSYQTALQLNPVIVQAYLLSGRIRQARENRRKRLPMRQSSFHQGRESG